MEKMNCHLRNKNYDYLGQSPIISAQSWAVFDCRKSKLLAGRRESERREMASITKMMTFYVAIQLCTEFRVNYDRLISTSEEASEVIGTSAKLIAGDQLSLKQLFYGMMLPSGNDAAHSIAEFFGQILL